MPQLRAANALWTNGDQIGIFMVDNGTTTIAAGYSKAYSGAANFEFPHKLTKLILNTQVGAGLNASDLTGMTVSISGLNTTDNFNLADGTLTALANANTFAPLTVANGTKYEAIIVPQNAGSMKVTFKLTSNEEFVWTVPSINFLSTTEYTFAITLQRTGVTVKVQSMHGEWNTAAERRNNC